MPFSDIAVDSRNRLVWVSPLPPLPTGIAQYSEDLLSAVGGIWNLAVLPEPGSNAGGIHFPVVSQRTVDAGERMVLHVGNSHFHPQAYSLAGQGSAVLVLHDVVLHHARLADFVRRRKTRAYVDLMERLYGADGRNHARDVLRGAAIEVGRFPLSEDLIRSARRVVVHSEYARTQVLESVPDATVDVVPMGVPLPFEIDRSVARRHFGISEDAFLITSITHVNPMKRMPVVLRAFRGLVDRVPEARLVIAGNVSPGVRLEQHIGMLGLESHVEVMGYLSDDDARILARAGDVSVNLRYPSTGETSASLLRLMGASVPVVVTSYGAALEIPEECVLRLPVDRLEDETLGEYLYWLSQDPESRQAIGVAGRLFVETFHSMGAAVDGYRATFERAWCLSMPALDDPHILESAPRVRVAPPREEYHYQSRIWHERVAGVMVKLGLGRHGGTIEAVARAMSTVGLEGGTKEVSMADNDTKVIDPELLEILACPVCKTHVRLEGDALKCDECGRSYRIENGIPVMLVEDQNGS